MNKKLKTGLTIFIILFILCSILPLPVPIDKSIEGVEIGLESNEVMEDTVRVKGIYYRYLFRKNKFNGEIQIKSKDPDGDLKLSKLPFSWNQYYKKQTRELMYYNGKKNQIESVGTLLVRGNFREIMIKYSFYQGEEERFFVSSVSDYQEAIQAVDEWTNEVCDYQGRSKQ